MATFPAAEAFAECLLRCVAHPCQPVLRIGGSSRAAVPCLLCSPIEQEKYLAIREERRELDSGASDAMEA